MSIEIHREGVSRFANLGRLTMAVSAVALVSACSSSGKQQEAAAPAPTAGQQAEARLTEGQGAYVSQTQSRIDQLTKFSQDLRTQAATNGADPIRAKKMSNAADDLDSLLSDVKKELADVQVAAPANWVDEKRDVEKTISRAETQYSNSVSLMQ